MLCIPHTNTSSGRIKHAAGRVCRKLTLDEPSYLYKEPDPKKEAKKREWEDVDKQVEYVIHGGKVQCKYASPPTADIVVIDAGRVSLQDKLMATNKDTNGKVNFNFTGVCNHPSQQKPSSPPPPCKAVINLGQWENCSETKINNDNALVVKSTIKCNVSGEDITIADSGQKAELTEVEPVTSPEMIIHDAYWIDEDYNERRELTMGETFQLHLQLQKYISDIEVKFHFENTDGDSCQAADVSGIVDKNGIVKIKDFQLKPTEPTSAKADKPKKATTDKTNAPKKETIKITASSPYCTVNEWAFIKVGQKCFCGKEHIDLRDKIKWEKQFDPRWGDKKAQDVACFKTCKLILENAGLSPNSAPNDSTVIKIAKEVTSDDTTKQSSYLEINSNAAKLGIDYIDQQLEKGYPVLVGVDHTYGKGYNEGTTDHFVVIVGRGCKDEKAYYLFYEVGTHQETNGKSDENKLYVESDNSLKGSTAYNSTRKYVVAQVRKNKEK